MTPLSLPIPLAWYYAGSASEFSARPTEVSLPGRNVVIYRGQSGSLHAVQSHCPHMNSPLSKAQVRGDGLKCSLHHWVYNNQGVCSGIPGAKSHEIPSFACLEKYSIVERHGHVFVHTAPVTQQQLPLFADEDPSDYACARVRLLSGQNHWSVATANAFDLAHFEYIHQRRPTATPRMNATQPDARGVRLHYEIHGKALADRLLVRRYGHQAQLDYTVWHGNLIFAVTRVGEFVNRMMVFVHPTATGFDAKLFVFTPKTHSPWKKLSREISAYFSYQFFARECLELEGVAIDPARLGPKDQLLAQYVAWLMQRSIKDATQSPAQWADRPGESIKTPSPLLSQYPSHDADG